MATVFLVSCCNESFKLWHVIRVCKVDHINVNVVTFQSLSEIFQLSFILGQRMADKNHNSLSLRLVLSMLEGKLSYLDSSHEVGVTIYLCSIDCGNQFSDIVSLGGFQLNTVSWVGHHSEGVFGVHVQFSVAKGDSSFLLTFPSWWRKITISVEFRVIQDEETSF